MNLLKTISDFHYLRVSLIVWRINGTSRIMNVDKNAGEKINSLLEEKSNDFKPFVIDFRGIVAITDGALSQFISNLIRLQKEVHFINIDPIKQQLRYLFDEFKSIDTSSNLSDSDNTLI